MRRTQRWLKASSFGFVLLTLSNANAVVHIVATVGDPIPNKGDSLLPPSFVSSNLDLREFNDQGDVVFVGRPSSLANLGLNGSSLYFGNANGFAEIARPGDLAPNNNLKYGGFQLRPNSLSDPGDVVYAAGQPEPNGQYVTLSAVYRWKDGSITTLVQNGDLAPDGNGTVSGGVSNAVVSKSGKVAIPALLTGTNDRSVILTRDAGVLTQVVRQGQTGPDGRVFSSIGTLPPSVNGFGEVAFLAKLDGDVGNNVIRTEGSNYREIVGYQQTSPRGGMVLQVPNFSFNDKGQAAFSTTVEVDPNNTHSAVFRAGDDGLLELARVLDPVPGGDGVFNDFPNPTLFPPSLNSRGQVVFVATLSKTSGGTLNNSAIYRGDDTGLTQVVRTGQLVPDGNGIIDSLSQSAQTMSINDLGQICFTAGLRGTSGGSNDNNAVFLWDDKRGLTQILRKGEPLFGSTLVNVNGWLVNNNGDIAFRFYLADGRSGIAIWSVPEPAAQVLLVAGALVAGRFFGRRRCT